MSEIGQESKEAKTAILEDFVGKGLTLMQQGKWQEAAAHFDSPETAGRIGYDYDIPTEVRPTKPLTEAVIKELYWRCAIRSGEGYGTPVGELAVLQTRIPAIINHQRLSSS
ncbi:MAG: hypothetical protein JW991_02970 [Candidatus Pacebacteria bacterium]|nr:hypothetical protein [Candidatus Paceibacterota bacterium]